MGTNKELRSGELLDHEREAIAEHRQVNCLQFRMSAVVKMNREIDINTDRDVSPGGYAMTMDGAEIAFDFEDYYAYIDSTDSTIIHVEACSPDIDIFEDLKMVTENHLKAVSKISEFFVFTGEAGETDLRPIKLLSCTFYTENGEISVNQEVCDTAVVCSNIPDCDKADDSDNDTTVSKEQCFLVNTRTGFYSKNTIVSKGTRSELRKQIKEMYDKYTSDDELKETITLNNLDLSKWDEKYHKLDDITIGYFDGSEFVTEYYFILNIAETDTERETVQNKVVNIRLYATSIIDTFEDFLSEKGVTIDNDEKEGDEDEAIIYGSDFDDILCEILTPLEKLAIESRKSDAYNKETYSETLDDYTIFFDTSKS